jgi:hypothetical protein
MSLTKKIEMRTYDREANEVFQAFYYAIDGQPGWLGIRGDSRAGIIDVKTRMSLWSWGEVMQVWVRSLGPGKTLVTMSSRVRLPLQVIDLWRNKRNIERVFSAAQERLGASGVAVDPGQAGGLLPVPPPPT